MQLIMTASICIGSNKSTKSSYVQNQLSRIQKYHFSGPVLVDKPGEDQESQGNLFKQQYLLFRILLYWAICSWRVSKGKLAKFIECNLLSLYHYEDPSGTSFGDEECRQMAKKWQRCKLKI